MSKFEGNNELILTHATIRRALEHYFNTQVFTADAAVEVKDVTALTHTTEFRVKVAPRKPSDLIGAED
jgi:hypothetical protein